MIATEEYRDRIFDHIPLYQTRLVKTMNATYEVREQVTCPEDVYDFLSEYFEARDREYFVALFLDSSNTIIGMTVASVGGLTSATAEPRGVFRPALLANAAAVILAHNHPSGNLNPSRQDIRATRRFVDAGENIGIPVHDHLIFGDGTYLSMSCEGHF